MRWSLEEEDAKKSYELFFSLVENVVRFKKRGGKNLLFREHRAARNLGP